MRTRLIRQIEAEGPMPFDEYMAACLYDPDDGFFSAGPLRSGKTGDFVTSPEISPWFGRLIGRWAKRFSPLVEQGEMARAMRGSEGATRVLIEVGAGSGALLVPLIAEAGGVFGEVYAVEMSSAARSRIADQNPTANVVASLDEIPEGVDAVLVANEVLDNMPAALARRSDDGWMEIGVGVDGGDLRLTEMPAREEVIEWCDEVFGDVPVGTVVTVQLAVAEWISSVFERFGRVSLCLIDYGAPAEELAGRGVESVVRTYRGHQTGFDWLQHPGDTDITVDVNLDGVTMAIARAGGTVRVINQNDFLVEQGANELIERARRDERETAGAGEIMDQLKARSERIDLEALIDPTGFGAFTVSLVE
ncbi:MAG: SAM-dependent methyltransferase [Actinomycetota bacterium]|nr:SAM-dependent methyltransferase [Actinomycetota bacterium]MDK1027383.1 SAM-dependent methyltransferase [Actinomycetota bacterium]MDK1039539.1 SAM-dependent methyltransferase [Actinomycetota bacterium]MDK1097719.1 SAM-dependent methyltransferase [Actinomycetota bacterium]